MSSQKTGNLKADVAAFWNRASCGEQYAAGDSERARYDEQARSRYVLEPYLAPFARFADGRGRDVLEVGVGMGADHLEWAQAGPRSLYGIDLTPRAVEHTRARFQAYDLPARVCVADAEQLPFAEDSFDIVYSWGVLHHSPDPAGAVKEVRRVLRPGGAARVMIYHRHSIVGYLLWLRYGPLKGRPAFRLEDAYAQYLESPGTKAYSLDEARDLFGGFSNVRVKARLSMGDLLEGQVGQRHRGILLAAAKAIWPRWFIKRVLAGHGLCLLIDARK